MELLQLKYFCEAAENENFTKTANKFGVPTSNISQTIKRLENELGTRLFERTANRIKLTTHGRSFYECVSNALNMINAAKENLLGGDTAIGGELRLLVLTNRRIVTKVIEEFQKKYPDVTFVIGHKVGNNSGDYHFCISDVAPTGKPLIGVRLVSEKMMLATRTDDELFKSPHNLELMRYRKFVTMGEGSRLHERTVEICRDMGFYPEFSVETDDPFYVRRYVEMGIGVAIVPSLSWRGLFSDKVKLVDINVDIRHTYVFYNENVALGMTAKLFLEMLKSVFDTESSEND